MNAAPPRPPQDTRPQIVEARRLRVRFIADAERFAAEHGRAACFRYLQWLTGCDDETLDMAVKKVFCDSTRDGSPRFESRAAALLKSLLHPFHYVWSKTWLWRRRPAVDFDLETVSPAYFKAWFEAAFAPVPGSKRLTMSTRVAPVPGYEVVGPMTDTVRLSVLLKLFLAPLFVPQLLRLAPAENRPHILGAYRRALGLFASHDGHFARFPCRHFVTYSDENNHPLRYAAFRRHCAGRFVVVQNGERQHHPYSAFSLMDDYLTFGAWTERLYPELRMKVGRTRMVGALCLNERHGLVTELDHKGGAKDLDVLFIDQGIHPWNGLDSETGGTAFRKMYDAVNRYKRERPGRRVAVQLRPYSSAQAEEKAYTLGELRKHFDADVEFLENTGKGESYAAIHRSRVVITFTSTLGHEAFFVGKGTKTLFVNFAGNPHEILSEDARFQVFDAGADFAGFAAQLDALLALELDGVPDVARERHQYFDGRVQERIAAFLTEVAAS